jgi:GT2 family glycosyltransferase
MGELGAVILHYRHWPDVSATIDAVLAEGVEPAELRIVDNASGDGSVEAMRARYPALADSIVSLPSNDGYASGMNAGIRSLAPRDVLLLTHETVLAPGSVGALRERLAERPDVGMVGPLLTFRSRPDTVYAAGGVFNRRMGIGHLHQGDALEQHIADPPLEVRWLDGACLLVRRAAFDDVGLFDEGYFLYYEETDFAARMYRRGWRIECVPAAHASQQPGQLPTALWVRNRLRFLRRNAPAQWFVRQALVDAFTAVRGPERALTAYGLAGYVARADPKRLHHASRPRP